MGIDDWGIGRSEIEGQGIGESVNPGVAVLQNRGQGIERSGIGRLRIGIWRDQVFGMFGASVNQALGNRDWGSEDM